MGSILVVCTGNICRSPVGEGALQALISSPGVEVTSAGTHAVVGAPPEPEAQEFLRRELGAKTKHRARQLTKGEAESVDLLLAMTEEHRSWIARTAPRAVRRVFTVREFAQLMVELAPASEGVTLRHMVMSASRLRARIRSAGSSLDIADPYRGTPEQYEQSFSDVLAASRTIASAITTHTTPHHAGDRNE